MGAHCRPHTPARGPESESRLANTLNTGIREEAKIEGEGNAFGQPIYS